MPPPSPARSGLDAVLRRPALALLEVAWRWTFGATALLLLVLVWIKFLTGIEITEAEVALKQVAPTLALADAFAHILNANVDPLLRTAAVLLPGLALLWVVAASVGRALTLRLLFAASSPMRFSAIAGLSFLRTALALAAVGAYFGSAFIASSLAGRDDQMN